MWIVTAICLVGTVLNSRKNKACFYFWAVGNVLWAIYDFNSQLYSRCALDIVQLALGLYGLYEWSKQEKKGDG